MRKFGAKRGELVIRSVSQLISLLNRIKYHNKKQFRNIDKFTILFLLANSYGDKYKNFSLPKKNGGKRNISSPCNELKLIQNGLNTLFGNIYRPNINVFGFVEKKSIIQNAEKHIGKAVVINIDLKDFFNSIIFDTIIEKIIRQPYYFSYRPACLIAKLLTVSSENGNRILPQGAPSSPLITNIVADHLDARLSGFAKKCNLVYTRYADDITFSTNNYNNWLKCRKSIFHIIEDEGFTVNKRKFHISFAGQRQVVTGLVVNEKVNVKREYIKSVRTEINNWEKDGYVIASYNFFKFYENKHPLRKTVSPMERVIAGKLSFIKSVKGKDNPTYIKLKSRYDKLLDRDSLFLYK